MKKIMTIALLVLGIESQAQIYYPTTGRLFEFSQKNYVLTIADVSAIIGTIKSGNSELTNSTGCKIKILHPKEWLNLVIKCYQTVDSTINSDNIINAVNNSQLSNWSSDISVKVRNYYWGANGGVYFINDYNGFYVDPNMPIIIYNGYPVMKMSCGNPLMPLNVTTKVQSQNGNNHNTQPPQNNNNNNTGGQQNGGKTGNNSNTMNQSQSKNAPQQIYVFDPRTHQVFWFYPR